ncbi:MAG: NAD(P)-dependent oxidoreductase [Chloroflexi bacterium]|nr:NAD(P)-dependent oxidoreductase [Chloroflexota bacterium]
MPESSRDQLIGFIGTGNIGNPMARNLIEAGHQLVVYDLRPEVMESLLELGADSAESCAEVASRCSIVVSSLPGPPEIEAAITSADGILAGASPGDIHVDLSSNSITTVRRLAQLEADAGVSYIDAPVTGGVPGAEAGTLTVLGSGDANAFERVRPLLDHIGSNIFHLGEAGSGCLFKLLNNVIILCGNQIVQEALVLGTKAGLDPEDLVDKLRLGTARPYMGLAPYLLGKRFDNPSFTLRLAEKDVSLAIEAARANQVPMPVANAAHQTYLRALSAGLGEQSFLATLQALEAAAGTEIPTIQIEGGRASL